MLLLAALLFATGTQDTGAVRNRVAAPRVEAEIVVDGVLDEPVWSQATRLDGFRQFAPVDDRPADQRTEVLVWYSPTAIYFGVIAHDRDPGSIRATLSDRDNIGSDDNVTVYLDTFNDRRRAFFFGVNPLGVQDDGMRSEGGASAGSLFGGGFDRNPDFIYQSKGRITDAGYVVEMRIPFKTLRYPGGKEQRWGFNVARMTRRSGFEDAWTVVRRASASFLAQAGTLDGLHDLRRGVVAEVQPFVTASAPGVRTVTGTFDRQSVDPSAGANLKLGFTTLAVDATVNPDFSQVESDAGLVTVNERFSLFFPERRPFFLEGIDLFATPNQLVYTRQVVDPIAGAKITGKFGRTGLAYLSAVDNAATDALFNIARLRRDVGRNSVAGLTYTDRIQGDDYNRVAAADTRVVFGMYYVQAQLGRAWTRENAASRSGSIWHLEWDRTGRYWGFNYMLGGISPGFATRSGFVNRTGIVQGHLFDRLTTYGKPGAFLETVSFFPWFERFWDYDHFGSDGAIEGTDRMRVETHMHGGWQFNAEGSRNFVAFKPADYTGYQRPGGLPFQSADELSNMFRTAVTIVTPTFRQFNADATVTYGETAIFPEASEGRELRITGDLSLRPTPSFRVAGSTTWSRIRRRSGGEFARTVIPRLRIEYQPSRSLFFRVIGEYQAERLAALRDPATGDPLSVNGVVQGPSEANRFRLDWLASLEPAPGTVAFLGYGSTMDTDQGFGFRGLRRMNDGFFVKVAYLFRW